MKSIDKFFNALGTTFVVVGSILLTCMTIASVLLITMLKALWHR